MADCGEVWLLQGTQIQSHVAAGGCDGAKRDESEEQEKRDRSDQIKLGD